MIGLFQVALLTLAGGLCIGGVVAAIKGWVTRREGIVWTVVWLTVVLAAAWPDVTTVIARSLGIGRGKDLILYCSVMVMFVGFLMVYARLCALRRDLA